MTGMPPTDHRILRLFRPGGTVAKRPRFTLVDSAGAPTRTVRLDREELAYLYTRGCLPSRGISGIRGRE